MTKTNELIPAICHGGKWRAMVDGSVQVVGEGVTPPHGFYDYEARAEQSADPHDFEITVDAPQPDVAVVVSRTITPRMSQAMVDKLLEKAR